MVEGMGPVPEKLGVSPLQLNKNSMTSRNLAKSAEAARRCCRYTMPAVRNVVIPAVTGK